MPSEQQLNHLATEFFRTFSRAEYALNAAGFHRGEGDAEPDCRAFALGVETFIAVPQTPTLRDAVSRIRAAPPKKQVIINGRLDWRDAPVPTGSESDNLFIYIRRVRNNLFHGGKFNGHWFAPDRSYDLLSASLLILEAVVEFKPDVQSAYHG